jgi:hypothetical protein
MDRIERLEPRRTSLLVLSVAMAISAAALMYFGRGQSFTSDEWLFVADFPGWSLGSLFHPDNGHLLALANVVLNASLSIFGSSYVPMRVVNTGLVLVNAGLFYTLCRRRVGPILALPPAILLLFFGSAFGIIMMPFSINSLLSIGFGLCALLALDREDLRGDLTAGAMLVLSVLSFEWGLFFAIGMAVEMWLRPNHPRLARFLIPAIPIAVWLAWRALVPAEPGGGTSITNIGGLFSSIGIESASLLAAITGLFRTPGTFSASPSPDLGVPLVVVGVVALVARLRSGPRPSPRFFALALVLILFWIAIGLTLDAYRTATDGRYVYGGAVVLFLLVAELLRGVRITHAVYAWVAVVFGFSLLANTVQLRDAGAVVRGNTAVIDARLGALEIVRGQVSPHYYLDPRNPGQPLAAGLTFSAAQYFAAVDAHGSFGTSPAKLLREGGTWAGVADLTIAAALEVGTEPVRRPPPPGPAPIGSADSLKSGRAAAAGRCLRIDPSLGRSATAKVTLPPGGFSVRAPRNSEVSISLSRFSTEFPVKPGTVFGSAVVEIPTDRSEQPWLAELKSARSFSVCSLQMGAG